MLSPLSSLKSLGAGIRTAWLMIGISLFLLFGAEGICRFMCWLRDEYPQPTATDVYGDAPWVTDYWREYKEAYKYAWRPYVYWRRLPYQGQWVNVDREGIRKTWADSQAQSQRPLRIFMFGGSTLWGTGARDDYTIASWVARGLAEKKVAGEITNFGETAYVSKQELIVLLGELEKGNVPDLVVFYDGFNDTFSAYQNGEAGIPQNEADRRVEFNVLKGSKTGVISVVRWMFPGMLRVFPAVFRRFSTTAVKTAPAKTLTKHSSEVQQSDNGKLQNAMLRQYRFVIETVNSLGKIYRFRTLYYWQPTVYQKMKRTPEEIQRGEEESYFEPFLQETYELVRNDPALAAEPTFHNISDIFAQTESPLFIDYVHTGETGNELIARRIIEDIIQVSALPGK